MEKNYILVAWRNLMRNPGFSLINISGLSIGMAAAILILLWIRFETTIDREYKNADRLYLTYNRDTFNGEPWVWFSTPKILAPTLKKDYAEIENISRVTNASFLLTVGEMKKNETGFFADPSFFQLFDFESLHGDLNSALVKAENIVITEDLATQLFGTADAVGKTVKIDTSSLFTVSAVLKDMPMNSRFRTNYFLPWEHLRKLGWEDEWWGNNSVQTYLLMKENVDINVFNEKIKNITKEHTKGTSPSSTEVFLYPLSQTYLYGKNENGKLVAGKVVNVRMFGAIAVVILLIACINFMNLTTARSEKRAKEVGIRKVAGASRIALIFQFLGECILLSAIAGVIALALVYICLPSFNALIDNNLVINLTDIKFWLYFFGFILITGILAGSYPAFFLSAFNPVSALKGTFKANTAVFSPRKVLVVLQFTFAIILIISTLIIQRQIRYAQDRETGYDKNNLIYIPMQGSIEAQYASLRHSLTQSGAVEAVTMSLSPITQQWSDSWGFSWPGSQPGDDKMDFGRFSADANFSKVLKTKIIQGRDIDVYTYPTDSNAVLLNQTAVKKMRLKEPIGTVITSSEQKWHVIGVVEDFIIGSPFKPIHPMMVNGPSAWFNVIHLRLNSDRSTSDNLATIEKVFRQYNPHYPFEYKFVDEVYARKFESTQRTGTLATLFAGLTIFISCLGLLGLSAFMAANRTKEIGVRKVMGASVSSIAVLLSKDFLKLVGISYLIATPIAWYIMRKWLGEFEYRREMEIWIFAVTGILCFLIAGLTVSFQAIKAGLANPVKSLRTE
jgi:putative ABC transport system permease protein